jgi:diacylglycerol kinase family enzyme
MARRERATNPPRRDRGLRGTGIAPFGAMKTLMKTPIRRSHAKRSPFAHSPEARPIEIVVTPSSGNGQAMTTALELRDTLHARGYRTGLEVFGDLDRLARWAQTVDRQLSALVCVGGDGTQSATAAAAVRRSVPFLPVSHGFGNLFARAFGHPKSAKQALDLLMDGEVIAADVGTRNGELFLCEQSYGLIADVQEAVEGAAAAPRSRWQRWLSYYRAALHHVGATPAARLRVVVDRRLVAVDAALVTVANVETYGAWLPLTPDASPVDGLFDVFVLRGRTRREVFGKLLRRYLRIPSIHDGAELCRGRQVSVSRLGSKRELLEVLPGALQVVVAPATAASLRRQQARRANEARPVVRRVA